jgi:hypothetical protein
MSDGVTPVSTATAYKLIQYLLSVSDRPIHLWGAVGIGKSAIVAQLAQSMGRKLLDVRASLLDPVDLRGLPTIAGDRTVWTIPDFLPDAERDGPCILFLDELNVAAQSVQTACYQLINDRALGEYTLPDDCIVIAAGNRLSDKANAQRMPSALQNRFRHVSIEAQVGPWAAWAAEAGIDPMVIGFNRYRPNMLHNYTDGAAAFPSPRTWEEVSNVMAQADSVPPEILHMAIVACVGEAGAGEFMAYRNTIADLPPMAEILRQPDTTILPSRPAGMYAVASALARTVDASTIEAGITYLGRLDSPEFQIVMVSEAVNRDESLQETAAFVAWAIKNQDVTL